VTPHVNGGTDDESDFTVELIRSILDRAADFGPAEIEIHSEAPDKPASYGYSQRLASVTRNITASLRTALSPGQQVRLVLWPKLLDRYIIAGVYTELADGTRTRSPHWGISMQHIARRSDERDAKPPTHWSLLTRSQVLDAFDRYCKVGVSGFASTSNIVA